MIARGCRDGKGLRRESCRRTFLPQVACLREYPEYSEYLDNLEYLTQDSGMRDNATARAVMHLASERPEWIPILRAACVCARNAEALGGDFAGAWVLNEVARQTGQRVWQPGLRTLTAYGLLEKSGESTRGGRRAYYRMPDRLGVELALQELARLDHQG